MERKIIAGTYTFVDEPEKLSQFTSATNILFDDNNGTVINYTTTPISGISTNKFVLAVDRPNETQRYLVYAFEATTAAGGALSISKGWYWFNESSMSLSAISTPSVVFSDNCSINDELTTTQGNALFTTSPIQVQPTVTTTRVLYKGKKELTMAQFEALASLDDAVDYDITDFPNTAITNAQMTAALGYIRLFNAGEVFVCADDGTYTKGHAYQVKVDGDVKSWTDITPAGGVIEYNMPQNPSIEDGDTLFAGLTGGEGTFKPEVIEALKTATVVDCYGITKEPLSTIAYSTGMQTTSDSYFSVSTVNTFSCPSSNGNYVLLVDYASGKWKVVEPTKSDLQNYVPTQSEGNSQGSVDPNTALTWVFNETLINDNNGIEYDGNITFETPEGNNWTYFSFVPSSGSGTLIMGRSDKSLVVYDANGWIAGVNRIITFETSAPVGTPWFSSNAVPQGETTKTYAQVTNENGAVSIRVFENSDADLQNLSITKDGVTINGEKPLTSVQPLYKHELVIPYSFSVGDSETVDGSVVYHYLSNTGTQITSASEIDDNFMLSGGIGKNSANTAASQSESVALTWVINESYPPSASCLGTEINFTSNGENFIWFGVEGSAQFGTSIVDNVWNSRLMTKYSDGVFIWKDPNTDEDTSAYRTVTFETAPTGDLLAWLQANAVPQGEVGSNTVLLFDVNVIKAGSSITVEAVNASTMGYITGTVGTITDTVTQLI